MAKNHIFLFIYRNKNIMKKKKKISVTIDKILLERLNDNTTNKSRLIEYILFEYATKIGIKINDIIL
jgi:hypothetical protein